MKTISARSARGWELLATLSFLLCTPFVMGGQPQTTPAQFDINAPIEKFTLDPACAAPPSALYNPSAYAAVATSNALACTATIVLNGQTITLPANTVITFPASFLTPYEAFAYNPLCKTGACAETGLAIQDLSRLPDNLKPASYEASIKGNVVYDASGVGVYIAGLVNISQQDLNAGEGFINYIDYASGELRVGGDIGVLNGARLKLNDPVGRYGRRTGPLGANPDTQDVRFAVDDGNPTIAAETGYPLCIPRFDPAGLTPDALCPETNRPIGGPTLNNVQMHIGSFYLPPAPGVIDPVFAKPAGFPTFFANLGDPRQQAPLEVGDYIHYEGTQAVDLDALGNKSTYVSIHTITANLGIYTTPGTDPAYLTQEVTIVGVGVTTGFAGPAEGRELFKVVGFTTDVARAIDTGMVQVDPCNGSEGFNRITTLFPNGSSLDPTGQALANIPLGRFRSTFLKGTALAIPMRPAAKEIRTQIQGSSQLVAANGLTTGQYTAPVSEYIFAENLGFGGLPIVPNNFEDFPFLSLGHGPWDLYDPYGGTANGLNLSFAASPIQGQLAPWPGSPTPATVSCALDPLTGKPLSAPPIINMSDLIVTSGAAVTLNATGSVPGTPGATLTQFSWVQTSLPNVMPVGVPSVSSPSFSFTAPIVTAPLVLKFQLTVTDSNGRVSTKAVNVTVNPSLASDTLQIPVTPTYRTKDGSWNVNTTGTDNTAIVSIEAYNSAGTVVLTKRPMTQITGSAVWNFITKTSVPLLADNVLTVKITSSKGGAVGPTAVAVRIN